MELIKLSDHIYYTECDPTADRPVLGYIMGEKCAVMVDAGNSADHVRDYENARKARNFPAPKYCVITHWHWDHTFGMHDVGAETVAHKNTNKELQRLAAWTWSDEAMKKRLEAGQEIEFADQHIRAEYDRLEDIKVTTSDLAIEEEMVIDCGGITCRCIHMPSAHSDDSVVIYVPEEKVLFIGDIYGDDFYNGHNRDMEKTRQLYQGLSALDFDTAVTGHSRPMPKQELLGFIETFLPK